MSKTNTSKTVTTETGQRKRVPFDGLNSRLHVAKKDPNFYYYIFNMVEDRVQRALNAGYDFVTKKEAEESDLTFGDPTVAWNSEDLNGKVTKIVGKYDNGKPIIGVLMKLPMKLHLEDEASKARNNDEIDEGLRRGGTPREEGYITGIDYNPSAGR